MNQIKLTIDGKELFAKENESILNIARANNIFIPAICYMSKCSATLACRLCLVETDGKQVYSCNAKAKDGMNILTKNESIEKERNAIMQVYDVNHPLQCGVCDKSGECELQDYSLIMKVDTQNYTIKDTNKPSTKWGVMKYDPALCIVCERCVTICSDMIGSNALSTVKRGGEDLDKSLKEQMPKDAYAMWNKLNKSLIGYDKDACIDCGECIAVCPTGAMISHDFQYTSNAWELEKIPASNPFSSDCAFLYYEVKEESILNHNKRKIYRVTNEPHFSALSGAARFAYNYENIVLKKDKDAFFKAINAFKTAKNIEFNSYITNEEAYILQEIASFTGAKLVNSDAKRYKEFLKNFSQNSGESLYNASLKDIHESGFIICLGSFLKTDAPSVKNALNNAVKVNKASALYFHPLKDLHIENIGKKGKTTEFINHKPFCEEHILLFILKFFAKEIPSSFSSSSLGDVLNIEILEILAKFEKDESFLELLNSMLEKKENYSLIIGEDLILNPRSKNLARLCGLIQKYTQFKVLIIPTQTNSLGVSLICDLEEKVEGKTIGYNIKADFELSALGDGDLDMPALNQQEGTFTNIDKKVVPTNAALPYYGYTLNDIANTVLEKNIEFTIDYTSKLSSIKAFEKIEFDDLANEFLNSQEENRGYEIKTFEDKAQDLLEAISSNEIALEEDEIFIYKANPINQFNEFSAKASSLKEEIEDGIFFSKALFEKLELQVNKKVKVSTNTSAGNIELELNAYIDETIDSEIAYVSTYMKNPPSKAFFLNARFNKAKIRKV